MSRHQEQETDGDRVKRLMAAWTQRTGMSQAAFAKQTNMPGGTSMISQHKSNHRPIGLEHARAYMAGFGCKLSDLSPNLAESVGGIESLSQNKTSGHQVEERRPRWAPKTTHIKVAAPTLDQSIEVLALHLNQIDPPYRDSARALLSALVGSPGLHSNIASGLKQLCKRHSADIATA